MTRLIPASVSTGMSAFLKACFPITSASGNPLSRASLTYSEPRTSSMGEAGDEAAVLHDQRLVEAELPADHLEIVPGGAGLDEQDRGIAGDPHEEKYGHRQEEQREERVANTSQDVSFHDYFFRRRSS